MTMKTGPALAGSRPTNRHRTTGFVHVAPKLTAAHYKFLPIQEATQARPDKGGPAPGHEPFRLFLQPGSKRFRMTFCIGCVRYTGSTLCEDRDLAVMVARVVYAEIRETAGRLLPTDVRRRERTVFHIRGCWLTSRPKRLPSVAGRTAPARD